MKKLFITLSLWVCTAAAVHAAPVFADDYTYQKQIFVNNTHTCQAFRIHENWFVTAAHCVDVCFSGRCQVKIVLAWGPVSAFAILENGDVFIPTEYRKVDTQARVSTHKNWDVALLHYQPGEGDIVYEYQEGGNAESDDFKEALKRSSNLRVQWEGAERPQIPVLYTYGGEEEMTLNRKEDNLIVPLWGYGQMQWFSEPDAVLYFGKKQALWGSTGFGVEHGNSGGAVVLEGKGIIGIAVGIKDNDLPQYVRDVYPVFGQAKSYFLFNGFAPKTTLAFIRQTMAYYGDKPRMKKLKRVKPQASASIP